MTSPARALARARRFLKDTMSITRLTGAPPNQTSTTATGIHCRIIDYAPREIAGTIVQGDQKIIALKDDLDVAGFPVPPRKGDKVTISDGRRVTLESVDVNTRKVDETLVSYELQARGT